MQQYNLFYFTVDNYLMETELELSGAQNDLVFVKHSGITNYQIIKQSYGATFDQEQNTVSIIKPIKDETFTITVLIRERGKFENYTLCTFAERKGNDFSDLGDYVRTFTSQSSNNIIHFIDFRSFSYT